MIRGIWVLIVSTFATVILAPMVFVGSMLKVPESFFHWVARRWSAAVLRATGAQMRVEGLEGVDWSEPKVVVSNHISALDILALAQTIPTTYRFVAKKELERVPLFGPAWKAAGHISIDRANRSRAIESLKRAAEILTSQGGAVVIFPEGTRSRDGELQPFKKGAFMLAIQAGVEIVPAVVIDSDKLIPPASLKAYPGTFRIHYCAPIDAGEYSEDEVDQLIDRVRLTMLRASGKE